MRLLFKLVIVCFHFQIETVRASNELHLQNDTNDDYKIAHYQG